MYQLADSLYHKSLRISALTLALLLLFVSGIVHDTTAELADLTTNQLANAIGVSVGVAPTELNMMTAELSAWQRDLAAREEIVAEREIAVGLRTEDGQMANDWSTFILATILFILLLLIILNYALDYMRRQPQLDVVAGNYS